MTTEVQHAIEIDASPAAVWAVLTDVAAYPEWNPFVLGLEGELRRGARLAARIAPPGGRPMPFRPTVLAAEPERELRWLGRLLVPGVFDGEHSFRSSRCPAAGRGSSRASASAASSSGCWGGRSRGRSSGSSR